MATKPVVDVMIVGAQKSATTSFFDLLAVHPQMAPCKDKEPQFFSHNHDWRENIHQYERLFTKEQGQLAFEASTAYTAHPQFDKEIWQCIYEYNPKVKIIYIVRNPLDRIISAHRFLYRRGFAEQKNINSFLEKSTYHLNLSKYYYQIQPYIKTFGKENVLILFFEDFKSNSQKIKQDVSSFLNINLDLFPSGNLPKSNTKKKELQRVAKFKSWEKWVLKNTKPISIRLHNTVKRKILTRQIEEKDLIISAQTLARLQKELVTDIELLESLTGRDLNAWKKSLETT